MTRPFVIGTRAGRLALVQTERVIRALEARWPGLTCRIQTVATTGDKDQRTALWDLRHRASEQGFFTSSLERALLARQIDMAVHSLKDLPTRQAEGLTIAAIMDRLYPEDCLVSRQPVCGLADLPAGAKVGTSSLRRWAQLLQMRSDLQVVPLRGNVQTRLAKLDAGIVDAVLLARAGLERLGLAGLISAVLDPKHFIPAPGQGALAVQVRSDDLAASQTVSAIDDAQARVLVDAERQVLVATGCGCHAPVGAFAESTAGQVHIYGLLADPEGTRLARTQITGPSGQAMALADRLGAGLLRMLNDSGA